MSEDLKITIDNDGSVHYNNDYVGYLSKSGIFNYRNECPEEVINYFLDKDYIVKKHISEATKSSDEKLDERSVSQKKNDVMFFVIKKVSDNTYFVLDDGDMSWSKDINDAESYDDKSDAEDALDFEIMEYVSVPQSITDEADILDYKDTIRETYFNIVPVYADEFHESKKSLKESKQKDITVDFEIPVNPRGRVRSTDAKKLLKHLLNTKQLKVGKEYFVTDINNNMTLWSLSKDDFSGYRFDCEITETPEGREVDVYHCLRFEKRNGRLTDFDWEANNVY